MHRHAVGRRGRPGDPQPAGVGADFAKERPPPRRCRVGVAQVEPGGGVQQGGAVAHRPGQGVLDGHAGQHLAVLGTERVTGPGGLEAEQPAAGGGEADRAAEAVGVGHGDQAGGDRRGRPAAGAAGGPGEVPGVAGRPEQRGLAGGEQAELGRVGLSEQDQPGAPQPHDQFLVVAGDQVAEEGRALGEPHPGPLHRQVLEQERHPGEGAAADLPGGVQGQVEGWRHHRVEGRVQPLDAVDRRLDQLDRGHLAAPRQLGLGRRVQPLQLASQAGQSRRRGHRCLPGAGRQHLAPLIQRAPGPGWRAARWDLAPLG